MSLELLVGRIERVPAVSEGPRERLKLLSSYFAATDTRFLVYSRSDDSWLSAQMDTLLMDLNAEHEGLRSRVFTFGLREYGEPRWGDPITANSLKLRVKEILELEAPAS